MQSNDFNVAGQFGDLCWNTDFTDTFQIMQIQWNSWRQVPLMKDHPSLLSCLFRQLFLHISIWMNSSSSSTSTHSTRVYRGIAGDKKKNMRVMRRPERQKKKEGDKKWIVIITESWHLCDEDVNVRGLWLSLEEGGRSPFLSLGKKLVVLSSVLCVYWL